MLRPNVVPPPSNHMVNPNPQFDDIKGGAFERRPNGHEDVAFMNGMNVLIKETPRELLGLFCLVRTEDEKKMPSMNLKVGSHQTLALQSPCS